MNRLSRYYLIAASVLVVGTLAFVWWSRHIVHWDYPLHIWRVDLDDALVGVGTILLGAAAIWTVALKQRNTEARVSRVEHTMNGGLAELAREHMQESEVVTSLVCRMDRMEADREECRDALDVCHEERKDLHERLISAIAGNGHEPGGSQE